jgi:hydroxymethylbilane synthase
MVLAACGLKRLEYATMIRRYFDPDIFVPAAGQGVICGQVRSDDADVAGALKSCSCKDTEIAALAERKVLEALEIGCQKPFGVYARFENGEFVITAKAYLEKTLTYIYERRKCLRADSEKATDELVSCMKVKMSN